MRRSGQERLAFVPDSLMDEPEQTKAWLRDAYTRLLELNFEILLLAHCAPVELGGKHELRAFVDAAR